MNLNLRNLNTNPVTNIPYGYISSQALDPEIVDDLIYGLQARDFSFEAWYEEKVEEAAAAAREVDYHMSDSEFEDFVGNYVEDAQEEYFDPEPHIEGEYDGVYYATSWLGGALNFLILESPVTTDKARRASPCVPGAAILDTLDGDEFGYDVPADWRFESRGE